MYGRITRLLATAGAGLVLPGGLLVAGLGRAADAATGPVAGTISTVAGGTGGPGPATSVSLSACTLKYSNGALYFSAGGVIDKVSEATGKLSAVAGNGLPGVESSSGEQAAAFSFSRPCGVSADPAGNVLVADGYQIEAVAAKSGTFYGVAMKAGRVYPIAQNFTGFAGSAGLGGPAMTGAVDVQVDSAGNLVIAVEGQAASHTDPEGDSQVVVIAERNGTFYGQRMTKGKPYLIAGSIDGYTPGNGVRATRVDLGDSIGTLRLDSAGNVVLAASGSNGIGGPDNTGPAVAPQVRVIAAKSGSYYGRKMTAGYIYTIAGGGSKTGNGVPAVAARLSEAAAVAIDHAGNVVVADGTVRVVAERTGTFYGQKMRAGDIYSLPGLRAANAVALDSAGNVLAGSDSANIIRMIAERSGSYYGKRVSAGHAYTIAGNGRLGYSGDGGPARSAELAPQAVATFGAGDLTAIADSSSHVVRLVPGLSGVFFGRQLRAGYIYTVAGTGIDANSGDGGAATGAALEMPVGVAFDPAGNLLIADSFQHRVRAVANKTGTFYGQRMTAGHLYTVAGDGDFGISADGGPARAAALGGPQAVAAGPAGSVLLLDSGWEVSSGTTIRVRLVPAKTGTYYGQRMTAGHIYTVAGDGTYGYAGDGGPATAAEIEAQGIAVDGGGNLVIADRAHVRVVAAVTGTFYGQRMTAGYIYPVAGGGTETGNGVPATRAALDATAITVDTKGNLLLSNESAVWLLTERPGRYYGTVTSAGDIYKVASSANTAWLGDGDGGPATRATFGCAGIAVAPGTGDLLIADAAFGRIRSVSR